MEGLVDVPGANEWRDWLSEHHLTKQEAWLVFHRRGSGVQSISYDEALDEALAYGWIDSIIKKLDDRRYARRFTPRRPGSIWSKLNVERVNRLKREGKMTVWGLKAFEMRTGKISLLDQAKEGRISMPPEFETELKKNSLAWANYQRIAPSHRKRYLIWIAGAKRPETRERRVAEAVGLIAKNVKELLK